MLIYSATISIWCLILIFFSIKQYQKSCDLEQRLNRKEAYYYKSDNESVKASLVEDVELLKYNLKNKNIYFNLKEITNDKK